MALHAASAPMSWSHAFLTSSLHECVQLSSLASSMYYCAGRERLGMLYSWGNPKPCLKPCTPEGERGRNWAAKGWSGSSPVS